MGVALHVCRSPLKLWLFCQQFVCAHDCIHAVFLDIATMLCISTEVDVLTEKHIVPAAKCKHVCRRQSDDSDQIAVPIELDALIGRCLEKDPANRPQTIAAVASALDGVLVHQPWRRDQIDAWWQQNWVSETDPGRRYTAN